MEKLINTLELLSGGSQVMSTDQLAKCLSMNPKVISRMRQEGRFPIPHKTIGSKIAYSIMAVANYLTSDEPEQKVAPSAPKTQTITPEKRRATSKKSVMPDLSRKMLMRGFLSALVKHRDTIENMITFFERKLDKDNLQESLKTNNISKRDDFIKI